MTTNNAVVKKKTDAISDTINSMQTEWAKVLPIKVSPERFARMAISSMRKNQKLAQAFNTQQGQLSTLSSLSTLAELGLEADGRRAHLIPYKNEVTLVIDYKGLVELVMRSGQVSNIHADKVCDNDKFEYNLGEIKEHKIDFKKPRGKAYAYYCIVTFKDGTRKTEIMPKEEIEKIRLSSPGKNSEPWTKWYDEMAKKTVFKRCSKWLSITPELSKAIEHDDQQFVDVSATTLKTDDVYTSSFEESMRSEQKDSKPNPTMQKVQPKQEPQDAELVHDEIEDNLDF